MSSPASGPTLNFRVPEAMDVTQPLRAVNRRIADRAIISRARRVSGLLWSSILMMALVGALEERELISVVMMAEGL